MRKKSILSHPYTLFVIACIAITAFFIIFEIFKPLPMYSVVPPSPAVPGSIRLTITREGDSAGLASTQVEARCDGGNFTIIGTADEDGVLILDSPGQALKINSRNLLAYYKTEKSKNYLALNKVAKPDFKIAEDTGAEAGCVNNCANCVENLCVSCNEGYGLEGENCRLCSENPGCLDCNSTNFSECTSCDNGYYLEGSSCQNCSEGCATCTGLENCQTCSEGYFYYNNACTGTCPEGTFGNDDNNTCDTCDPSCAACDRAGSNGCTSCPEGYTLENGACVQTATILPAEASCDDNDTIIFRITKSGYVSKETDGSDRYSLANDNQYSIGDVKFSQKITITSEISNSVTPSLVTAGSNNTDCLILDNIAYCPVPVEEDANSNDISITAAGFVTNTSGSTSDRTNDIDAQQEVVVDNLAYAYKVSAVYSDSNLENNLVGVVGSVSVGDDNGANTCNLYNNIWYCPVLLSNSDGRMIANVIKAGYFQKSGFTIAEENNRLSNSDNQVELSLDILETAVKVSVFNSATSRPINQASIKAGDNYRITCQENDSTGVYYCPVPSNESSANIKFTANGYLEVIKRYTPRDNAQVVVSIKAFEDVAGGVVIPSKAKPAASDTATSATEAPMVTEEEDTSASLDQIVEEAKEILQAPQPVANKIEEDKFITPSYGSGGSSYSYGSGPSYYQIVEKIITPETKPETKKITSNFIVSGTESTSKLSPKERASVISSYKDTYGKVPETKSEWTDVLKVSNGRWPSEVAPAKEKLFIPVFEKIYQRSPNFKSEKEKNAISIMTYGIRPAQRNINSEVKAVNTFLVIFGHLPNSPRDWDIVRGIAYSGVSR